LGCGGRPHIVLVWVCASSDEVTHNLRVEIACVRGIVKRSVSVLQQKKKKKREFGQRKSIQSEERDTALSTRDARAPIGWNESQSASGSSQSPAVRHAQPLITKKKNARFGICAQLVGVACDPATACLKRGATRHGTSDC
jgi:hypothetical protein